MSTWRLYNRNEVNFDQIHKQEPIPIPPLAEIQVEPDIHDHIKIDDHLYSVCILSHKEKVAYMRPIELGGDHDTEWTSNAICPHCGHEHVDCFEWSDDEGEQECARCDLPFAYTREVSIEYSTEKKGPSHKPVLAEV